ncbi:acyltransferase [Pseudomonas entomophila]|uniref:acyltransferase family protein n=1 Tax=Pseudomonas entomophila TaxID=312306 RepID=UPI0015E359F5|nr:acyltransferase family protein [Pseudomonas entomophila]MBA1190471.1 acyltransferase [Pseudomonas entomophila]
MQRTAYRPDIDGLRAVAVIAVFLHHLGAAWLPGGFVGVDIFFVISGYLITAQVFQQARAGTFSLRQFYQRRINRIVPALATVLFATLALGAVLLSPVDLERLSANALFALLGVSNLFIWLKYGNYFAADASEAPLLHTWSLGIEEQFYMIWPLLLLALLRWMPRRWPWLLGLGLLATIGLSHYGTGVFVTASYYLLPTRFFELMLGGCLGIWHVTRPMPLARYPALVSRAVGWALVVGSLALIGPGAPFPGLTALLPCLGAALLIHAGHDGRRARLLGSRPLVFIGLISYSLYLWHWPLIAYLNYLSIPIDPSVGLAVVLAAVVLAWLTWRWVEQPLRRSGLQAGFATVFARRFALPAVLLAVVSGVIQWQGGFPARFGPTVETLEAMTLERPADNRRGCHVPNALYRTAPDAQCRLGAPKAQLDGILVGDSFANHFTGMVDLLARPDGVSLMDYTMDGCAPILGYNVDMSKVYAEHCAQRNARVYALIEAQRYPYVVLAGSWPSDEAAGEPIAASLERVVKSTGQVIVILNNQAIQNAATCPVRQLMFATPRTCDAAQAARPQYWATLRARFPQVRFIDPNQVICAQGRCRSLIDGKLLYLDNAHLNEVGSRYIGKTLLERGYSLLNDPPARS